MAKYTIELGTLIENKFDIGLQDYPIYKEEYREPLNKLIIEHFYFREIGLETPQLFKRFLNRKMNEIMPYYNQLYKSEDVDFNPLYNVDMKETFELIQEKKNLSNASTELERTDTTSSSFNNSTENTDNLIANNNNQNESFNAESDTPQSEVTTEEIKNNKYISKANYTIGNDINNATENRTSNSVQRGNNDIIIANSELGNNQITVNEDGKQSYIKKTEGSSAGLPFSKAISQWRKIMLNINMQIIEELEPLFMQIW